MFPTRASRRREHGSTTSEPSGESHRRPEAHDRHRLYDQRPEVDPPRRSDRRHRGYDEAKEQTFQAKDQIVGAHKLFTNALLLEKNQ